MDLILLKTLDKRDRAVPNWVTWTVDPPELTSVPSTPAEKRGL